MDLDSKTTLTKEDSNTFDVFVIGGILGNDPPQKRTGVLYLPDKGIDLNSNSRQLGPKQMTVDTAFNVTRMIAAKQSHSLEEITFRWDPQIEIKVHKDDMPVYVGLPY